MGHSAYDPVKDERRVAWNAGRIVGAKRALKPQQVWAIRFFLERERRMRDRALFDLAIDSKLRGCDLVKIRIGDLVSGGRIRQRAIITQKKTGRPVQFELLEPARSTLLSWLERRGGTLDDFVFPAELTGQAISAHGNTPGLSMSGLKQLASTGKITAHIHCVGPRLPSSTNRQAICGQSKFFLAIRKLKAPSGISGSTSKTP